MKSTAALVEKLIWPYVFGGLLFVGLGLALRRGSHDVAGWVVIAAGGVFILIGAVLVWVRSRLDEPAPPLP